MADATARVILISDGIVADINANVADGRWEAKRSYYAEYRLSSMAKFPQVDVLFVTSENTEESRGTGASPNTQEDMPFEISVQKACAYTDTDQIDTLVNLVSRIAGRYKTSTPLGQTPGFVTDYPEMAAIIGNNSPLQVVSNEVLYFDPICLKKDGHFHGRISLILREFV